MQQRPLSNQTTVRQQLRGENDAAKPTRLPLTRCAGNHQPGQGRAPAPGTALGIPSVVLSPQTLQTVWLSSGTTQSALHCWQLVAC